MSNRSRLGKMSNWQRQFVLLGILSCSMTGIAYLLGHEFYIKRSTLGAHAVLAWHGVTAIIATVALGSVLPVHLKAGLKSKRKFWSGVSQLTFLIALCCSGALLYYGSESIRDYVIVGHWVLGLIFFAIFLLHGVFIRKDKNTSALSS